MQRMRLDFHAVVRRPAIPAMVLAGALLAAPAPARAIGLGATVSMLGEREDAFERYGSEEPENDLLLPVSPLEVSSRVALRLDGSLGAGLSAEAAAALWLTTNNPSAFSDDGSYLRLRWQPSGWTDRQGLTVTVFPFDSSRLHLGDEYPAIWGSRTPFGSSASGDMPGLEVRLERESWLARVFAKSAIRTMNRFGSESERLFQVGMGGGVDVLPVLRLELEGGGVDQGTVYDSPRAGEITGSVMAVSGRALYHRGAAIGRSVDLSFYGSEPGFLDTVLVAESYPGGVSASVSLEGSWLSQTGLSAMDGGQKRDWSGLAAIQARLKVGYLRAHALGWVRSIWFGDATNVDSILWSQETNKQPERLVSVGVDHHFPALRLTPGLVLRAGLPASFETAPSDLGANNPAAAFSGSRTVVVKDGTAMSILPSGVSPSVVVTTKATLQWAFGDRICAIGEAWWKRDPNRMVFRDDAAGVAQPVLVEDDALGLAFLLQAGF